MSLYLWRYFIKLYSLLKMFAFVSQKKKKKKAMRIVKFESWLPGYSLKTLVIFVCFLGLYSHPLWKGIWAPFCGFMTCLIFYTWMFFPFKNNKTNWPVFAFFLLVRIKGSIWGIQRQRFLTHTFNNEDYFHLNLRNIKFFQYILTHLKIEVNISVALLGVGKERWALWLHRI